MSNMRRGHDRVSTVGSLLFIPHHCLTLTVLELTMGLLLLWATNSYINSCPGHFGHLELAKPVCLYPPPSSLRTTIGG
jgi:hypothetical protein